jgi:ribose-phosphate pyrophosphokinase
VDDPNACHISIVPGFGDSSQSEDNCSRAALPDFSSFSFTGYTRDTYLLESNCPRFASGEAKGTLSDSVRGADLYIMADVTNTGIEYNLGGRMVPMTPDEHYADIKRVIAASAGKALSYSLS